MGPAKFIVNPRAGHGRAQAAIEAIDQACQRIGMDHELVLTEGPGHAVELARQAALAGCSPVVAAGGDGTVSEVVNGLLQAAEGASGVPLGVIPLGLADDFANALDLDREIDVACRRIQAGHLRAVDVGCVNGRYFDSSSAVGLEPMVRLKQARMQGMRGRSSYLLAGMASVAGHRPWHVRLAWDDGAFEGPLALVSVGNTSRTGGLFWMTPRAEPDDGALDFISAGDVGRLRLAWVLSMALDGRHVQQPEINYHRTTHLTIDCDPPTPIQADGEVLEQRAAHIEYTILLHALQVIVPAVEED